jgi:glycosyltransferase involved in cell wall biosynthesis
MTARIAILRDFPAENWPSMDRCADKLLEHLPNAADVCPDFLRVAVRLPGLGNTSAARNADRFFNRFAVYGNRASLIRGRFDVYHVADHSYAHLVHHLPANRTGVYCHDVDTFRSLVDPAMPRRPKWFRAMAARILSGLRKAAVVFHSTNAVRAEIEAFELVDPAKLVHAPLGVSPTFTDRRDPSLSVPWLDALDGVPWILHVGSCIPRKRIDVLLDVLADVRRTSPNVKLLKIGGEWTDDQARQIDQLSLSSSIIHRAHSSEAELAEAYRRASLVVVPSDAEGFGLPVAEALACGAIVLASDIPALRESGGPAAVFAPVGDVPAWADTITNLLTEPRSAPSRRTRLEWAKRFSWSEHARIIEETYANLSQRSASRRVTVAFR